MNQPKKTSPVDVLLALALFVVLALTSAVWYGFALKVLWGWFVVPLGASAIGVFEAAGLALLVSFLATDRRNLVENKSNVGYTVGVWIAPAITILFGALIHAFA